MNSVLVDLLARNRVMRGRRNSKAAKQTEAIYTGHDREFLAPECRPHTEDDIGRKKREPSK